MKWRVQADSIHGKVVLPAPWGTEFHRFPCLVFHEPASELAPYSVVEVKETVLTAKTARGLKGVPNAPD